MGEQSKSFNNNGKELILNWPPFDKMIYNVKIQLNKITISIHISTYLSILFQP